MRVGSNHMIDIDIRILSASNKNLKSAITQDKFRADLYYRLSTFTITIPPLRKRREDILPLFCTFSSCGDKLRKEEESVLLNYQWPGNVRELQNVAAYFDVIGTLDPISTTLALDPVRRSLASAQIKERIVRVLACYPDAGLGRGRILALLKNEGISLSENRFEHIIQELLQEQIIFRGKGRQGIRLVKTAPYALEPSKE